MSNTAPPPSARRSWSGGAESLRNACPTSGCSTSVGSASWSPRSAFAAPRALGYPSPRSYSSLTWARICVKSRRSASRTRAAPGPPRAPPRPSLPTSLAGPRTSRAAHRPPGRSCRATGRRRFCSCRSFWWTRRSAWPGQPAGVPPPLPLRPGWSPPAPEPAGSSPAARHTARCTTAGHGEQSMRRTRR